MQAMCAGIVHKCRLFSVFAPLFVLGSALGLSLMLTLTRSVVRVSGSVYAVWCKKTRRPQVPAFPQPLHCSVNSQRLQPTRSVCQQCWSRAVCYAWMPRFTSMYSLLMPFNVTETCWPQYEFFCWRETVSISATWRTTGRSLTYHYSPNYWRRWFKLVFWHIWTATGSYLMAISVSSVPRYRISGHKGV